MDVNRRSAVRPSVNLLWCNEPKPRVHICVVHVSRPTSIRPRRRTINLTMHLGRSAMRFACRARHLRAVPGQP